MIPDKSIDGLIFDERNGAFVFLRPDGEGRFEYSQVFRSREEAVFAFKTNALIYGEILFSRPK